MLYILYAMWCSRLEENPCTQAGDLCLKSSPCATLCRPRCVHGILLNIEQIWHIIGSKRDPEWVSFTIFFVEMISLDDIIIIYMYAPFDTLRLRQNGPHFPDDIFQYIFLNENEFRTYFDQTLFLWV